MKLDTKILMYRVTLDILIVAFSVVVFSAIQSYAKSERQEAFQDGVKSCQKIYGEK